MSCNVEIQDDQREFQSSSLSKAFLISFKRGNMGGLETDATLENELHDSIRFLKNAESFENRPYRDKKTAVSAGTLAGFLAQLVESNEIQAAEFEIFSSMLRPSFLRAVFEHRRIVLQVPLPDAPELVVDWVGFMLFKLSQAVLHFSGPSSFDQPDQGSPWSDVVEFKMSPMKYICATNQLPVSWSDIHSCLNSTRISAAAKRIALCLLFGVYMLSSYSAETRSEDYNRLLIVRKSLHEYLKRPGLPNHHEELPHHIFQSQYSILLVLFTSLELDMEPLNNFSFHLSMIDRAMDLIGQILLDSPEVAVIENLTEAQVRLLRWDSIRLWCWRIWDIGLLWHERILQMTATWLYHFVATDSELCDNLQSKFCSSHVPAILLTIIDMMSSSDASEPVCSVLFKTCWALLYVFDKDNSLFSNILLQKALQIFSRLLVTIGHNDIDVSIREVVFQFILKITWNPVMFTEDTMHPVLDVAQRVRYVCTGDDATNFDEGTVTNYLSILILSCHGSPTQLSEIADTLFLSRVASLVEDSMWSTTIRLNAFLLLSYLPKLDETSFPRLLSTMLKRTSPHDPLHAGILAACVYKVAPILPKLDPFIVFELWYYLLGAFLIHSNSETTEDLRRISSTIACALTHIASLTSLKRNPAWSTSPWTAFLKQDLISRNQLSGAQALLEQLCKVTTGDSGVSNHVFTQRLSVVYIQGRGQLMSIVE